MKLSTKTEQTDQPNSIHSLRDIPAIGYPGRSVIKMKKTIIIISLILNLTFVAVFIISSKAIRLPDQQSLRLQSAYKISNGLLKGKIKPEEVLSENKWYLLNKKYLDK